MKKQLKSKKTILDTPYEKLPIQDERWQIDKNGKRILSQAGKDCGDLIKLADNAANGFTTANFKSTKLFLTEDVAEILGVTQQTIRNWEKAGKLIPFDKTEKGHRRYSQAQIDELRKKQMTSAELIVPEISMSRLKDLAEVLVKDFDNNEKVNVIITPNELSRSVDITIESLDGLKHITKSFKMED